MAVTRKQKTGGCWRGQLRCAALCFIPFVGAWGNLFAQQDTTQKAQPETRRLEIPVTSTDSTEPSVKSRLPKFDLPEYVITGDASINMPALQKESAPDDAQSFTAASLLNLPLTRTRMTAQAPLPMKETNKGENENVFNGTAFASLGTFFTPQAGLWYGQTAGNFRYSFNGHYARSKGFAPFTDRSGGGLEANGGTTLKSDNPNFDLAKLQGDLAYESDTYNWYGTSRPSVSRNRSDFAFSVGLSNWSVYSIPYSGTIGVNSFQVSDSTADVSETTVRFEGATRFNISSVPIDVGLRVEVGSVGNGSSTSSLAFADATLSSQRYEWRDVSLEGSLHGYFANGMGGQRLTRLYPHLDVAYRMGQVHTLRGTFGPEITPSSLSSALFAHRYLSAESQIRHIDDQLDGALSLESEWTSRLSTKFEVRAKSIADCPLYADSAARGMWLLAYGGKTTVTTISGEIFAKLPANDYFASDFVATMSHNSATGRGVPYLPGLQLECRYGRQFADGLRGVATLTVIHVRTDNVVNIADLPSILLIGLRGRYQVLPQAEVFLDIENLLNQTYEYWRRYQENPFVISAGVRIRW